MTLPPYLLSYSGGKDSILALDVLRHEAPLTPIILLTTVTRAWGRVSIHGLRHQLLRHQVRALGLPLELVVLPPVCDNDTYEARFGRHLARHAAQGSRILVSGDIFLSDVRAWRERLLARHGFTGLFPLWGEDTRALAQRFLTRGYRAVVIAVDTQRLSADWAGREYDERFLAELPPGVDPAGENGEFHTFVYNGPAFGQPVRFRRGIRVLREGRYAYQDLEAVP